MATDADAPFEVGEIVRGITRAVRPFGVFVRLERGTRATDGLIRAADASRDGATFDDRDADEREVTHAMEYFYPIGSPVFVKVKRVTREGEDGRRGGGWRVALDASAVDQETGDDLDPERKRWTRGGGERDERFGGGASALEQPLDALVDNEALGADQDGKHDDLVTPALDETSGHADRMQNDAELTGMAGTGEDFVGDPVAADMLEELVYALIECVDAGAERTLAGDVVER